jgi:hypothetical protein
MIANNILQAVSATASTATPAKFLALPGSSFQ